ncbi:MAG: PAS domain S-box protein [Acidobacteria bacterium]|nr:PAS domain S-box protein [Acidobacteriota bacterium]
MENYRAGWRPPAARYSLAVLIAGVALGTQLLLHPFLAPDSYQLLIASVALSAIYLGARAGLLTLGLVSIAKLYFFLPPLYSSAVADHKVAARLILFVAVGLIVCSMGGRLQASEETFAAVLTSIGDAVIASGEDGRIRFLNPAARELCGWKQEEAIGQDLRTTIPVAEEESGTYVRCRSGKEIPVEYVIAPIKGMRGGVVMVLRDITERHKAEEVREELIHQLQSAFAQVKQLSGLLPICSSCKKIRDSQGSWQQMELYIRSHSKADFSHGLCPDCLCALYPEFSEGSGKAGG